MGGDSDDESRTTVSADQLLSMGSCSVQEIDQVRLIVAWGNAFAVSTDGLLSGGTVPEAQSGFFTWDCGWLMANK